LEVENDSNDGVVQALEAQNQILSENNKSTDQTLSVTLTGIILNAFDKTEIPSANITVMAADVVIHENLAFTGGEFKLENLPARADIELIISSNDDSFLPRTFFMNTGYAYAANTPSDFGEFLVSEGRDVQVSVMNKTTGLPLSALEFIAYSHSGNSSRANKYKHTSVYDEVNGVYKITVPKFLNIPVRASLDLNKDGEIDFITESNSNLSGNDLYFQSATSEESFTLYLEEITPLAEVEYRITLIDESANTLLGANLLVTGSDGVESESTFDAVSEQYVLSAKFGNSVKIEMPSFSVNDINYQSSSIQFDLDADESIRVYVSGTSGNSYYNIPHSNIVELAIMPRVINSSVSTLEVVTVANKVNFVDQSFSVFYSQPITASASSLSLTNTSGFTVVKGNDDSNDVVLPGTTVITGNVDVPVSFETSLNNTKLTITPNNTLSAGQSYQYNVDSLVVVSTEQIVNISGDILSFNIDTNSDVAFDINDVRLDNNNFTTNGVAILATNSAGDSTTPSDYDNSVYFYFPESINTLQSFSLRLVSVTKDGVSNNSVRDYTIVNNGTPYGLSPLGLVSLASNEILVSGNLSISIEKGTAQPDSQKVYRGYTYQYTSDNLNSSENSLTFQYAYETKAGVLATGTITIPVQ
jgi:hypothetical protein